MDDHFPNFPCYITSKGRNMSQQGGGWAPTRVHLYTLDIYNRPKDPIGNGRIPKRLNKCLYLGKCLGEIDAFILHFSRAP